MQKKVYIFLFAFEVAVVFLASSFQKTSGYMDADYYYANALNLASGKGFNEFFVWNYLDNPKGIPHPSFAYWMPLASIVSSIAMIISGIKSFEVSRIPFFLLAGLIPVLSAHIALRLSEDRKTAWMAALFSIFSGFYLVYLGLPETFLLYMVLGACFFEFGMTIVEKTRDFNPKLWFFCIALGIISGLMYLTRADGVIWLIAGIGLIVFSFKDSGRIHKWRDGIYSIAFFILGYIFATGAWYYRNFLEFGTWMPAGGMNTLWLTDYNQMFIYPSASLSFNGWWEVGFLFHLKIYLSTIWSNLQTFLIVQGEIFLVPLMVIGILQFRKMKIMKYFFWIFIFQFAINTFIFPFAGARGGFFHSGSAFQTILWATAGFGFWKFLDWGVSKRGWQRNQSSKIFVPATILIIILFSGLAYWQKVIGNDLTNPIWDQEHQQYSAIEAKLLESGYSADAQIMIKNPPGYFVSTNRPAFVIPDGDLSVVHDVAEKYNIEILAIDQDHVPALDSFYLSKHSQDGFTFLFDVGNYQIFSFIRN